MSQTTTIEVEHIPAELKERAQWVLWRSERRGSKPTKVPKTVRGSNASTTDPETWTDYQTALAAFKEGGLDGIGFVFSSDDDHCGLDLDDCIDETGAIHPDAQIIIDRVSSYTEVSPSGRGVKIYCRASLPSKGRKKASPCPGFSEIGIYDNGRYFCVTGQHVAGTPTTIEDRQIEVTQVFRQFFEEASAVAPSQETRNNDPEAIEDAAPRDVVEWARAKLQEPGERSDRDFHVVCRLIETGLSQEEIRRIVSGLSKFASRNGTYFAVTYARALAKVGNATKHESIEETAKRTTDVGNAARLIIGFSDKLRYCYTGDNCGFWLLWDGRRWKTNAGGETVRLAKKTVLAIFDEAKRCTDEDEREILSKHAVASQKRERITAMVDLARPELGVFPDMLDADPWAFNCLNGTIDLRTGRLRRHNRDDLITKLAPVEFDPDAKCPLWDAVLHRTFDRDADLIQFVQRLEGMALTGDVSEQIFVIYWGKGANGKSLRLDTICGIMGDYACEAPPNLLTMTRNTEHPTEIADLMGRRLVVASETEEASQLKLQLVKRLTGNQRLKGRFMRQDYFEFNRTFKLILVTNNKPVVNEDGEAAWRRIRLIPHLIVIPLEERDKDLLDKLRAEWPGILAWLVRGCLDWQRYGLDEPEAVRMATASYRNESDLLAQFMDECCIEDAAKWVSSHRLRSEYETWCKERGVAALQGNAFTNRLVDRGYRGARKNGTRGWLGLDMKA